MNMKEGRKNPFEAIAKKLVENVDKRELAQAINETTADHLVGCHCRLCKAADEAIRTVLED